MVCLSKGICNPRLDALGVGIVTNLDTVVQCTVIEWQFVVGLVDRRLDLEDPIMLPRKS